MMIKTLMMMIIQVVQMSFAAGLMNPLIHGTKLSIMDQFFLGGPLTLRGFTIKGAGPHEDGLSVSYSELFALYLAWELLDSV